VKRAFDFAAVVLAAPFWGPVLGVIAFLVRIKLGSPIFFRQKRPGLNAKIFEMIKFRTMTDACDAAGNLLPDAARLTPFLADSRVTAIQLSRCGLTLNSDAQTRD
jgi:lipopolysaccharide/colanic/teichoic acid biosynthesis glycosyltransferase